MDNKKYMLIRPSPMIPSGAYLSCVGGGATVASTDKIVIIGIWDIETKMSNGNLQNTGDTSALVERMALFLAK